jgi:hypothetical protein
MIQELPIVGDQRAPLAPGTGHLLGVISRQRTLVDDREQHAAASHNHGRLHCSSPISAWSFAVASSTSLLMTRLRIVKLIQTRSRRSGGLAGSPALALDPSGSPGGDSGA